MTTAIVATSTGITGNVGSCTVNTTSVSVSSFYVRTIATNSCTGQVMGDYTYYDWEYVYTPITVVACIIVVALAIALLGKFLSDN